MLTYYCSNQCACALVRCCLHGAPLADATCQHHCLQAHAELSAVAVVLTVCNCAGMRRTPPSMLCTPQRTQSCFISGLGARLHHCVLSESRRLTLGAAATAMIGCRYMNDTYRLVAAFVQWSWCLLSMACDHGLTVQLAEHQQAHAHASTGTTTTSKDMMITPTFVHT